MNHHPKLTLLAALCLTLAALGGARAQQTTTPVSLPSAQFDLDRLAPGRTSGEAVFNIDRADNVVIDIAATVGGLDTRVIGPAGQEITPGNAAALGGSFSTFDAAAQQGSGLILNTATSGFHYVFAFPWMGTGAYTVRFTAPANLSREAAVLTQVMTDSKIGVALIVTEPVVVQGNPSVLSAAVFEGSKPVAGATVSVAVQPPTGQAINLTLRDDGGAADSKAGDGLYSGELTPGALGRYEAVARITGTAPSGTAFTRQTGVGFVVVSPKSTLTGNVEDQGVDEDGDSLLDKVSFSIQTNTLTAGQYRAFVRLKTARGQAVVRSSDAELQVGGQSVRVDFEAEAFRALGEDGPYDIELVELLFLGPTGPSPSDRRLGVGKTKPYLLSEFSRPAIFLTGVTSDLGVDTDGNRLFDRLRVAVQVNVRSAGQYSWSVKLTDQNLREIDFAGGSGFLSEGLNDIEVEFSGEKIGASGANGPYLLRDLLIFGTAASLLSPDAGQTAAHRNIKFEGFTRPLKEADLAVGQSASPNPVVPGARLTFTAAVTNNGPDAATAVKLSSVLPPSVTFVSCAATGGGACGGSGNNRTVGFASLAPKTTATVTLVATVKTSVADGTVISASSSATSGVSDPEAGNNAATAEASLVPRTVQFDAFSAVADEGRGSLTVTVTRSGNLSQAASVDYATSNGTAVERSDYTVSLGRLRFAAGEARKQITVLLTDDGFEEGAETIQLALENPTGAGLGAPALMTLSISDNDAAPSASNPADNARFFVRQHYHDFLNREPDAAGLNFWASQIESCSREGAPAARQACLVSKRQNVSAAFFLSIEFQETGYLAYRAFKAAFGDAASPNVPGTVPVIRLREFLADAQQIGRGVQVGVGAWQQQLENNKNAYALEFVRRPRFTAAFPASMTPDAFVTKLDQNAGGVLSAAEKSQLVASLGATPADALKRAAVLRRVAEDPDLHRRETNRAFVLMQYYGYLRRNPDDGGNRNFGGWRFWLDKLNQFNGNFVQAEMVLAFISSVEYRQRFGR